MAIALGIFGLACLAFIFWLTVDGLRAVFSRFAADKARRPLQLRVVERRETAGMLLGLVLADSKGKPLPPFEAGQHVLLQAPAGPGGKTIQRAYSLAAWQQKPGRYELGIKREAQGEMSQWLWNNLQEGSTVSLSRPQGHFVVPASQRPLVLIGGGIGITPMRAMLHEAVAQGRAITLFHAARTVDQLLYREEFEQCAGASSTFRYIPILSCPDETAWVGLSGRLSADLILREMNGATDAEFSLCASDSMMAQLRSDLLAAGVAEERIHWEAFGVGALTGTTGIPVSVHAQGAIRAFSTAGAPTLLAELEANDIALPSECRAGSCGQCLAILESGEVDWLGKPEFDVPAGKILPCVCAPRSPLAISLD